MKKGLWVLIFSVLIFLPMISAVEFDMNSNFRQGETILAHVSGNFLTSITKDNIFFYRGHVEIPIEYDVANIDGDYYIYALTTGKNSGDYSISIKNVKYMEGAAVSSDDITKNFTITNETADFSVSPGFVVTSDDFSLAVQNLADNPLTIDVKTQINNSGGRNIFISPENITETSVTLKSGETKQIDFSLGAGEPTFQTIMLTESNSGSSNQNQTICFFWENCSGNSEINGALIYEIPVYVDSSSETESQSAGLRFEPSEFTTSLQTNSQATRTFYLYNNGDTEIKNISLSLSDSLISFANLSQTNIENLSANSHIPIKVSFFSSNEKEVSGNLNATAENFSASSFIYLNFLSNYTSSNETQPAASETCSELNGIVCNESQKCDTTPVYAKDNICCLTNCQQVPENNSGRIIAIVILSLITILLIWFYFAKYRKAKRPVDLMKIAKGKKE